MIFGVIVILGGLAIFTDGQEILRVLREADWERLPYAFGFMALSYFFTSYSFAWMSRMTGIRIRVGELIQIGFTTLALNHLLTTGGVAGYSLRYLLMRKHGATLREVITVSVLHFYITSLFMVGMLPFGLVYLILNASLSREATFLISILVLVVLGVLTLTTTLILRPGWRKPIFDFLSRVSSSVFKRNVESRLDQFDASFTRGVKKLKEQPRKMVLVVGMIFGDWLSSAVTLWFCFDALGPSIRALALVSGYVVGIVSGGLSLIPGGLGVQEGSMSGIYVLLGASFEQALLASILFRVVFYILPFMVSLVATWQLIKTLEPVENRVQ